MCVEFVRGASAPPTVMRSHHPGARPAHDARGVRDEPRRGRQAVACGAGDADAGVSYGDGACAAYNPQAAKATERVSLGQSLMEQAVETPSSQHYCVY
jgi:hypothetical protein